MSRSVVLERIRRARERAGSVVEAPPELPEFPRYQDPVAKFREEVQKSGSVFLDARRPEQLSETLSHVLQQCSTEEIYWEGEELFQKHGIPFRLRDPEAFARGFLVYSFHLRRQVMLPVALNSKRYERGELSRLGLSMSSARFGVAETGTLVQEVKAGTGRLLAVLPPAHAVLLSEKDLLMNHAELFGQLCPGEAGSALTLVTGPSRTADIEKTLIIGVHGPKQLFVVLTR